MPDILIRHAEPTDIPHIHAIYADGVAAMNTLQLPYQPLAAWEERLKRRDGMTSLVAVIDDEVVGQLGLETYAAYPRRRHVATLGMGVKGTHRKQGVGSALLAAAIELCDTWLNIVRIELEVFADNTAAVALYERHGFAVEGRCAKYAFRDGKYADALIMARLRPGA